MSGIIITLIILLFSVVIHELCHGVVADKLGDHTARLAGRLTINPLPHLDLFGSILLPLFLFLVQSPIIFGAAKPVPVNFFNLRNPKRDMALVSLAGPGANFFLALAFAIPVRLGIMEPGVAGYNILLQAVVLNLVLGIFNLLPIPPLDGSKIFASLFSDEVMYRILSFERFGFILIILFLYMGLIGAVLIPVIRVLSKLFLGFSIF
ncbi:MAG: site-2 protease family protein [Candidatus Doudnabacteria bacterium]|nr:site-2 protease family protein [bacterium]MDZ4244166.1 site-2 protease family protein [Candidatus Doudnabacteria bacterium]